MSASTIERNLKGLARKPLGALRKTYRTKESKSLAFVEVGSGERIPACDVEPGDIQVDTAALCGGDLRDNFIWVLTLTDRRTQWTEIRAVWNKGAEGIFAALEEMLASFPFRIYSLHYDNGAEFMNAHLVRFAQRHPNLRYARSRTGRCNDNAHVEQKNESVVRKLFRLSTLRRPRPPGSCQPPLPPMVGIQQPLRRLLHDPLQDPAHHPQRLHPPLRHPRHPCRTRPSAQRPHRPPPQSPRTPLSRNERPPPLRPTQPQPHPPLPQARDPPPSPTSTSRRPTPHRGGCAPPRTPRAPTTRHITQHLTSPPPSILQCPVNDEHLPTPLTPSVSFLFDE